MTDDFSPVMTMVGLDNAKAAEYPLHNIDPGYLFFQRSSRQAFLF